MRQILFCLLFLGPCGVFAQDDCVCCDFRQRGQTEYNAGRYEAAIEKWQRAKKASDVAQCPDLDALIAKARRKIADRDAAAAQQRDQNTELQRVRAKADDDLWDVLKDGTAADCDKYLAKYPSGRHAQAARDRKKALTAPQPATSSAKPLAWGSLRAEEFVLVKGGAFDMGCTSEQQDCDNDEKPVHSVTLSGFYLGKYEVTQKQWRAVTGANPSSFKDCDDCPVEQVSWDDVQEFLQKLNQSLPAGQPPYRLPTEAEWEYAAREGGKPVLFGNGKNIADPAQINFDGSSSYKKTYSLAGAYRQKTSPVGSFPANALGLYDMSGNVREWCSDWYGAYSSGSQTNPPGPSSGSDRVLRGGSWYYNPQSCRVANRGDLTPGNRDYSLGFRLARTF